MAWTLHRGGQRGAPQDEVEAARLATLALRQSKQITQADLLRMRHIIATRTEALRKQAVGRSRAELAQRVADAEAAMRDEAQREKEGAIRAAAEAARKRKADAVANERRRRMAGSIRAVKSNELDAIFEMEIDDRRPYSPELL